MSQIGAIGSIALTAPPQQSGVKTLTGTSGGAVGYDSNFNINFAGTNVSIVGDPLTNTLTFSAGALVSAQFETDSGTASPSLNILKILGTSSQGITTSGSGNTVTLSLYTATISQQGTLLLATNAEAIAGVNSSHSITSSSLSAKLGSQTLRGLPIGQGSASAISWTAAPTDGQLLIGSTGNDPILASLTSPGGTISITPGPGSIQLESVGSAFPWASVSSDQTMVVNNGYITTNDVTPVALTLPVTASVGATLKISGLGLAGWIINQNASQQIISTGAATTVGGLGAITSGNRYNSIEIICVVTNTTWKVNSINGTVTFT